MKYCLFSSFVGLFLSVPLLTAVSPRYVATAQSLETQPPESTSEEVPPALQNDGIDALPSPPRDGSSGDPGRDAKLPLEDDQCISSSGDAESDLPMMAIRPIGRQNLLTNQDSPTLLFYIPQSPATAPTGQFILLTEGDENGFGAKIVYDSQTFQLSETPGILALTLPTQDDGTSLLEVDETDEDNGYYRWYFYINCFTDADGSEKRQVFEGLIRRVPNELISDQTAPFYYDELANEALIQTEPDADTDRWRGLLQLIELESYGEIPFVGEIELPPQDATL